MNTPITKDQLRFFKLKSKGNFVMTGQEPNRSTRRYKAKKKNNRHKINPVPSKHFIYTGQKIEWYNLFK